MGQIGQITYNKYHENQVNRDNVIADAFPVPENGWLTTIRAYAGSVGPRAYARFCVWDNLGQLRHAVPQQEWTGGLSVREAALPGVRIAAGSTFQPYAGFWVDPATPVRWGANVPGVHDAQTHLTSKAPPQNLNTSVAYDGELTLELDYVANQRPQKGEWRTVDSPSGDTGDRDPVFSGTIPHPASDAEYDRTTRVQAYVYDLTDGFVRHNDTFDVTDQENEQGYWKGVLRTFAVGKSYRARFRHADSFGVWSPWSDWLYFNITDGPNRPTVTRPSGVIAWLNEAESPYLYTYSGEHTHPTDLAPDLVRVQVYTYNERHLIYDSGFVAPSAVNDPSPGDESYLWYLSQFHGDFGIGSAYAVRARTRSTDGLYSAWGPFAKFVTDDIPNRPEPIEPVGGKATAETVLRVRISDPHPVSAVYGSGTIAQARAHVYDSTGTLLAGYPKDMQIVDDGTVAELDIAADITAGQDYTWQCDIYDDSRPATNEWWSELSDIAAFQYRSLPGVTLLFPRPSPQLNRAVVPSPEYDPDASRISLTGTETSMTVQTVADGDALLGDSAYHVTKTNGDGTLELIYDDVMPMEVVGPQWIYLLGMKLMSGQINAQLRLQCLDTNGAIIATLTPDAATDAMDVPTALIGDWTVYGNITSQDMPAGTVSVRAEVLVDTASAGEFRVDACLTLLTSGGSTDQADFAALFRNWYGYFDGDTQTFAVDDEHYSWTGVAGESASRGLNRLVSPNASVGIVYSSAAAKADDRLLIQLQNDETGVYEDVYDSGWSGTGGARTAIPLPGGFVKNEGAYRLKTWVRDTNSLDGESEWAYFDTSYTGVGELDIAQASANPDRATITVAFEPSALLAVEFVGIEVEVSQPDGSRALHLIDNYGASEFVYHFPVSGFNHRFRVRQIGLVGSEYVEGPWREISASCEYSPVFFLKDAERPEELSVPFRILSRSLPQFGPRQPRRLYHTWGSPAPKAAATDEYHETGNINVTLQGPGRSLSQRTQDEDLDALAQMHEDGRVVCLLAHKNARKVFATLTQEDPRVQVTEIEDYSLDLDYSEVTYHEDYRKRGVER